MKILITGLSGYIGKDLKKYIGKKNYIKSISRYKKINENNIQYIKGDLNNINLIRNKIISFNPDVVIYLAWYKINKLNLENSKKNYLICKNFFELIFNFTNCKKIIITGSCLEYKKKNGPCKENSQLNNELVFAKYKNKILKYVKYKCRKNKIAFFWFRLFYVIGPNQRSTSLIPTIIDQLKNKKKLNIKNPHIFNDYVSIEKVSKTIIYCLNHNVPSGIYNIGNGFSVSVEKIISLILKKLKINNYKKTFVRYDKNNINIKYNNFCSDNSKYDKFFNSVKTRSIAYYIKKMPNYYPFDKK